MLGEEDEELEEEAEVLREEAEAAEESDVEARRGFRDNGNVDRREPKKTMGVEVWG